LINLLLPHPNPRDRISNPLWPFLTRYANQVWGVTFPDGITRFKCGRVSMTNLLFWTLVVTVNTAILSRAEKKAIRKSPFCAINPITILSPVLKYSHLPDGLPWDNVNPFTADDVGDVDKAE
jgi:hypothetical protein